MSVVFSFLELEYHKWTLNAINKKVGIYRNGI